MQPRSTACRLQVGQQFGLIRSSHGCRTTENQIDLSAIAAVTDSPEGGAIGSRAGAHAVDPVETAVLGLATESGAVFGTAAGPEQAARMSTSTAA